MANPIAQYEGWKEGEGPACTWTNNPMHIQRCTPEELETPTLYVEYDDDGVIGQVSFACPCGCEAKKTLSRKYGHEPEIPGWAITTEGDKLTMKPSIWFNARGDKDGGCTSHFWITANKVVWA